MDPPDPNLDGRREVLEDGFRRFVASLPPAKPAQRDSCFVKLVEVPNVTLSLVASKFKDVALHERGLVGHFTGL